MSRGAKVNILKAYHKLPADEFKHYLDSKKNDVDTLHFFKNNTQSFFLSNDDQVITLSTELVKKQLKFDSLLESFSPFSKKQLIQSFLIDEIKATNQIEHVTSTRHDIFSVMSQLKTSKSEKIKSIVSSYEFLLANDNIKIETPEDIRNVYDKLVDGLLEEDSLPDGRMFRKNEVFLIDGVKQVHIGFYPEEKIEECMLDFLSLFNNSNKNEYVSLLASHFLLEEIHPFYDGNGRLGRLLLSLGLFKRTGTYFSFCISESIQKNKSKYYRAFKDTTDVRNHGDLNTFVLPMLEILIKNINEIISRLEAYKNDQRKFDELLLKNTSFTKSQKKVISFLNESKWNSFFGVSNKEIMENCNISKRTLLYFLNEHHELVNDSKFGKITYHQLTQDVEKYLK